MEYHIKRKNKNNTKTSALTDMYEVYLMENIYPEKILYQSTKEIIENLKSGHKYYVPKNKLDRIEVIHANGEHIKTKADTETINNLYNLENYN
jgi:hypothetical protein